ncbi:uncharacterized protein LOC127877718 [Dreissena polymorpha]|uniref:uncharacterized protein LOC127877718 n=1 Tax=Dreissena polymorpha TaxID=45954 RepID=UPI0022640475|nr:uncharacterized protein LOC127877718 [Dreissena polymorpha]
MKKDMWTKIAEVISAQGIAVRTADECSNKWQNLKRESKAAVTSEKLERRKTGGGTLTLTAVADEQKVRIAEMYKDSASFNGIIGGLDSDEADGRHFLSNTTVAPAVGTVEQTERSSECCNKGPAKKQKKFATKSEELQYWQVQYFKGEVEKQEREKQLLDIRIRMLLKEEMRRDQNVVDEIINGKFFED